MVGKIWGDRGDLNPRHPGPQPGALTELSYGHQGETSLETNNAASKLNSGKNFKAKDTTASMPARSRHSGQSALLYCQAYCYDTHIKTTVPSRLRATRHRESHSHDQLDQARAHQNAQCQHCHRPLPLTRRDSECKRLPKCKRDAKTEML